MNTSVKLPPAGTMLPIQYLSTLNQLPTVDPSLRLPTSVPDMHFLHQLRAPGSSDINQAQRAATNAPSQSAPSQSAPSQFASGAAASGVTWASAQELLQTLPPVSLPRAATPLPSTSPAPAMGGLPLPATAESFPLDPKTVSSDQLKDGPESATQAMQQFVGETFYGMLLKQMRNTVMASDLFGNSSAKQMFESQLDQTLVQELATHHSEFLSRPIRI